MIPFTFSWRWSIFLSPCCLSSHYTLFCCAIISIVHAFLSSGFPQPMFVFLLIERLSVTPSTFLDPQFPPITTTLLSFFDDRCLHRVTSCCVYFPFLRQVCYWVLLAVWYLLRSLPSHEINCVSFCLFLFPLMMFYRLMADCMALH